MALLGSSARHVWRPLRPPKRTLTGRLSAGLWVHALAEQRLDIGRVGSYPISVDANVVDLYCHELPVCARAPFFFSMSSTLSVVFPLSAAAILRDAESATARMGHQPNGRSVRSSLPACGPAPYQPGTGWRRWSQPRWRSRGVGHERGGDLEAGILRDSAQDAP
jgi:hypothetical protein